MFHLSIVTPEKVYYDGTVKSLVVPGSEGYLGVLSNHAPLITELTAGKILFTDDTDRQEVMAVSGGFFEVSNNEATVLADLVETADDIDIEQARSELAEQRERLKSADSADEREEIRSHLKWYKMRVRVHEDSH